MFYYEMSRIIADRKARAIRETGAEAVVTTCPGCRIQLIDTLRRNGLNKPVLHLVDLLVPGEDL